MLILARLKVFFPASGIIIIYSFIGRFLFSGGALLFFSSYLGLTVDLDLNLVEEKSLLNRSPYD
jgi:hypothetical protein